MKKIAASLVATALIAATSASADFIHYDRMSALHLNVEGASMTMGDTDTTGMEYGVGADYYGEKLFLGLNYNGVSPFDDSLSGLSFASIQGDVGYRVTNKLTAYGILSYDIEFNTPLSGVGFGAGVKYQVLPYVALNAKYKTTSMSGAGIDSFDYNTFNFGLEFNFRTGDNESRY